MWQLSFLIVAPSTKFSTHDIMVMAVVNIKTGGFYTTQFAGSSNQMLLAIVPRPGITGGDGIQYLDYHCEDSFLWASDALRQLAHWFVEWEG